MDLVKVDKNQQSGNKLKLSPHLSFCLSECPVPSHFNRAPHILQAGEQFVITLPLNLCINRRTSSYIFIDSNLFLFDLCFPLNIIHIFCTFL